MIGSSKIIPCFNFESKVLIKFIDNLVSVEVFRKLACLLYEKAGALTSRFFGLFFQLYFASVCRHRHMTSSLSLFILEVETIQCRIRQIFLTYTICLISLYKLTRSVNISFKSIENLCLTNDKK